MRPKLELWGLSLVGHGVAPLVARAIKHAAAPDEAAQHLGVQAAHDIGIAHEALRTGAHALRSLAEGAQGAEQVQNIEVWVAVWHSAPPS
jgi:hypothetical protein